jgi:protein involved in polysaccharide export with SLBB domain
LGDVIDVKFYYNPELNETVTIRPDGKISLQMIDEVEAAGLTPRKLNDVLTDKYSGILRHPNLPVIVKTFAAQKVYVGGEVNSPGLIPIRGKLTALQAVFQSGGFKDTAESKSVVVIRDEGKKEPLFITLNLNEELTPPAQDQDDVISDQYRNDIHLKPYDVVFVPMTTIAKLNQFVDKYIDKLIPISRTMGFSWVYNLNPEVEVQ